MGRANAFQSASQRTEDLLSTSSLSCSDGFDWPLGDSSFVSPSFTKAARNDGSELLGPNMTSPLSSHASRLSQRSADGSRTGSCKAPPPSPPSSRASRYSHGSACSSGSRGPALISCRQVPSTSAEFRSGEEGLARRFE